jgi:outer membrane receptor protein involved in Fe transport
MPRVSLHRAVQATPLATALLATAALVLPGSLRAEPPGGLETIDVIGTTPLGADLDADSVAGNVQTASAEQIREQGALDLAEFMKRNLGSVFVNDAQSNPLQPDIQYRGFVGSPLLGLPQGLAVYQDGMRINEPFGDTVNWALIPESAIETVYLMPGSNPLFGLNALGGALSIETKNGFSSPGTRAEVLGGSFGRFNVEAETGGVAGERLSYFATASYLDEDGWRDYSPTRATQVFANVGTRTDSRTLDASLTFADTDLYGNGAAPIDLLDIDRAGVFTRPDRTQNELEMLNLRGTQHLSRSLALTGNVYVRSSDIETLNGDDSDFEECASATGLLCEIEDGGEEILIDDAGNPIAAGDAVEGATVNRTRTDQDSLGLNLQAGWHGELRGRANHFTVGIAYDDSDVEFASSTELGALDGTRLAVPGGVFVGESFVELAAATRSAGLFVTNTLTLGRAALTLSGRYNRVEVELEDEIDEDLNGDHTFERFNPAVALTYELRDALVLYAGYSEANRAPSPVELTCADPDDPCRLPNAFLADPPLEQVVAKTYEGGLRGRWASGRWHAGVFRTTNDDDILFVSAGELTNQGFFANVGSTRRDGVELNLDGAVGERLTWSLDYTYLDATFREDFAVTSPNNPGAVNGEIEVEISDRLPLVPQQLLKAGLRFEATDRLTVGGNLVASGGFHFRGDEANLLAKTDGYAVLSLRAEYRLGEHARVFANLDNVLDEQYETFGVLGEATDVLGADFDDPRFLGPGAPRAAWIGVRVSF